MDENKKICGLYMRVSTEDQETFDDIINNYSKDKRKDDFER